MDIQKEQKKEKNNMPETNQLSIVKDKEVIESKQTIIDVVKWNAQSIQAVETAKKLVVSSVEEEEMAINFRSNVKKALKELEGTQDTNLGPFTEIVKRIRAIFKPPVTSFEEANEIVTKKLVEYGNAMEKKQLEERQKAETERRRLIAEAQKISDETGEEIIIPKEAPIVPDIPKQSVKSGTGATFTRKKVWKAEVTSLIDLVKAVAEGKVPVEVVQANGTFLTAQAKVYKKDGVYPGVRFFEDVEGSGRS